MTLRGEVGINSSKKIMSFDSSSVSYGWRVLDFRIMTNDSSTLSDFSAGCSLSTVEIVFNETSWRDNQCVAIRTVDRTNTSNMLLDYDHVIVTSLFCNNFGAEVANYLVVLEQIHVDPSENIIYQLKERAQS